MLVHLRFPAGIRVKFKAGQHLNLILDNGERRDFSMANPPRESDGAQLHIRHVPGGAFTSYVFEKLKRGDRLKLEIPFGDFTLRDSDKPILFVAGSTGFAPIKSIIEDMIDQGHPARHDALLGRADARAGFTPICRAKWAAQQPALQIRAGAVRRARARHPPQPGAPGRAGGSSAACRLPGLCLRRAGDDAGRQDANSSPPACRRTNFSPTPSSPAPRSASAGPRKPSKIIRQFRRFLIHGRETSLN